MAIETQDIAVDGGMQVVKLYERDAGRAAYAPTPISAGFPCKSDSPGRARRLVVAALGSWGAGGALVDDAALMVSELATNAVRHARSSFSVTVRAHGSTLHIAVQDGAPLDMTVPSGGLIPQPLHGLSLVELVSAGWGLEGTHDGKVVWAELALSGYDPSV